MIVADKSAAYVGPFDRICRGLGAKQTPRNYRLERSIVQCSRSAGEQEENHDTRIQQSARVGSA